MPFTSEDLHAALKRHFGHNRFRLCQEDAIAALVNRRSSVFVLMPTGREDLPSIWLQQAHLTQSCMQAEGSPSSTRYLPRLHPMDSHSWSPHLSR